MTEEELKQWVDSIISNSGDPENAHGSEDYLYRTLVKDFCPSWVKLELKSLTRVR
jgi:hypothetical protein